MNDLKNRKIIGVMGQGQKCSEEIEQMAEEVGFYIAQNNGILICGGLSGVMEAASRGAKRGYGLTIGILPGFLKEEANPYIDIPIVTGISVARNVIIARTADALIAVGGFYGTLSEIAYGLAFNKPVIGLKTWDIDENIHQARNAKEAVELAFQFIA